MALLIASAVGMIATFLPWASVMGFSVSGTEGDGWISFALFGIILILALLGNRTEPMTGGSFIFVVILFVLTLILGIFEIYNINSSVDDTMGMVSVGMGVYLIIVVSLAGIFLALQFKKAEAQGTVQEAE